MFGQHSQGLSRDGGRRVDQLYLWACELLNLGGDKWVVGAAKHNCVGTSRQQWLQKFFEHFQRCWAIECARFNLFNQSGAPLPHNRSTARPA